LVREPQDQLAVTNTVTDIAAVCALSSPWWLHALSDGTQFILPFLGAAWLIIQITGKLYPFFSSLFRKKPE
jgi:hypothetical protein